MSEGGRGADGRFIKAPALVEVTVEVGPAPPGDPLGCDWAPAHEDPEAQWDRVLVLVDTATMAEYWRGPIADFAESNDDDHTLECCARLGGFYSSVEVVGTFHLRRAEDFDAERKTEIVSLGDLVARSEAYYIARVEREAGAIFEASEAIRQAATGNPYPSPER